MFKPIGKCRLHHVHLHRFALLCAAPLIAFCCIGCQSSSLKTHPLIGKIELSDGDVGALAGSTVEFMQDADPLMRSNGKIQPDGAFTMETMYQGEILNGVPEGSYTARIIVSEEDEDGNPRKGPLPINKRFTDFKSSGLTITVPSESVTLKVSKS